MRLLRRPGLLGAATRSDRRGGAPVIERIAFWSARHAKTAVIGWFGLVGAAFLAGQLLGTQSLPQFDPGQAGQGERVLHQLNVTTPPTESVLIQPRGPGAGQLTFANDPQMRQAVQQVTAALDRLHSAAMDVSAPSLVISRPVSVRLGWWQDNGKPGRHCSHRRSRPPQPRFGRRAQRASYFPGRWTARRGELHCCGRSGGGRQGAGGAPGPARR